MVPGCLYELDTFNYELIKCWLSGNRWHHGYRLSPGDPDPTCSPIAAVDENGNQRRGVDGNRLDRMTTERRALN
jgi:hypothetical protein